MRATIGLAVGFPTTRVINHDTLFKWHLCACDKTHQYLFVCERRYEGDYPLSSLVCGGLRYDVSYVSLRKVLFYPKLQSSYREACRLPGSYLRGLYEHIQVSEVMSPLDKSKVMPGLARAI